MAQYSGEPNKDGIITVCNHNYLMSCICVSVADLIRVSTNGWLRRATAECSRTVLQQYTHTHRDTQTQTRPTEIHAVTHAYTYSEFT